MDNNEHLSKFLNGGSMLVTKATYNRYMADGIDVDGEFVGYPPDANDINGSNYILPHDEMDKLLTEANGDISVIEKGLGMSPGTYGDEPDLIRVDIMNPENYNLRMPNGKEAGANENYIDGGYTSGGFPEAVIDQVPNNSENITYTPVNGLFRDNSIDNYYSF